MTALDQKSARKVITHLKGGTTPLDTVEYINVGNEPWYKAADYYFQQIEQDNDSLVRFVNGYPGDGKTHFLGMLRTLAMNRNWGVSYVSAETTPFCRYDLVLSEIVKNFIVPPSQRLAPWLPSANRGGERLLGCFFTKYYIKAYGGEDKKGLDTLAVHDEVTERVEKVLYSLRMHDLLTKAVRQYVKAALNEDLGCMRNIATWLQGQDAPLSEYGIKKKIDQTLARDVLRGISLMARGAGLNGVLILMDEAERIIDQTRSVRKKCYGVIRDLLDNADDQGGMPSSMFYIAATPDMFDKPEGFAEYDALRSRLANSQRFALLGYPDWRGIIVDLTKNPLRHEELIQLVRKIRTVHSIALAWDAKAGFPDSLIQIIVTKVEAGVFQVSKLRMLASLIATLLEIAEQNRGIDVLPLLDQVFQQVAESLTAVPAKHTWE